MLLISPFRLIEKFQFALHNFVNNSKKGIMAKSDSKSNDGSDGTDGADIFMLRQFGVRFYSAFWGTDKSRRISKFNDAEHYVWTSVAGGCCMLQKDTGFMDGESKWGPKLCCCLKAEEKSEFLEEGHLSAFAKKFIGFPIQLHMETLTKKDVCNSETEEEAKEERKGEKWV